MGDVRSFREVDAEVRGAGGDLSQKYGEKKQLIELLDKTIVVREYVHIKETDKGPLYLVSAELLDDGKQIWFFTRAPWIVRYKDVVPFKTKIARQEAKSGMGYVYFFTEP